MICEYINEQVKSDYPADSSDQSDKHATVILSTFRTRAGETTEYVNFLSLDTCFVRGKFLKSFLIVS